MAKVLQHKVVAALPAPLEADSIYYVRVGEGFDVYVTNGAGTIVAYPANYATASALADKQNTLVPGAGITIDPVTNEISAEGGDLGFTIIYPNGGSAASPANVAVATRYVISNPFPGFRVLCSLQYLLDSKWTDIMMTFYSAGTYGGSCGQVADDIVLLTGSIALDGASYLIGSLSNNPGATATTTAQCRISVWKIGSAAS